MQSLWKKAVFCALILTSCLPVSAMNTTGKQPQEDPQNPVPFAAAVKKDGKWGVINDRAEVVIPMQYDKAAITLAPDNLQTRELSAASPSRWNLIEVQQGKKRGFYSREGQVIVPVSYTSRSAWMEDTVVVQTASNRNALYDINGTELAPAEYSYISPASDGMAAMKKDGKYGFLSISGNTILPQYEEVQSFADGLAPVKEHGKWGVIDKAGRTVVPSIYQETGPAYAEGLLAVKKDNRWGFIDKSGKEIIAPSYKKVQLAFQNGMAAVQDNQNLWGFVDSKGVQVIAPQYKAVYTPFSEGLAGVSTVDGKGYIHPDGRLAFMADYAQLFPFHDGIAEYRTGKITPSGYYASPSVSIGIGIGIGHGHHRHHPYDPFDWWPGIGIGWPYYPWGIYEPQLSVEMHRGYIDNTGRVIVSAANDHVFPMTETGSLVLNDNRFGYVNRKGEIIAHLVYRELIPDQTAGLLLAKNEDKKWGALSLTDGTEIIPFQYNELSATHSPSIVYKQNGRYGLMTNKGLHLTAAVYDSIADSDSGLFPAEKDGQWLYLSTSGKEVIHLPDSITDARPFVQNAAAVKENGKWGLINHSGQWIASPEFDDIQILPSHGE